MPDTYDKTRLSGTHLKEVYSTGSLGLPWSERESGICGVNGGVGSSLIQQGIYLQIPFWEIQCLSVRAGQTGLDSSGR